MKTDFQLIVSRLQNRGLPFRFSCGQPRAAILNHIFKVEALPDTIREDAIYVIPCSALPENVPSGQFSAFCLEDGAVPSWLLKGSCRVILSPQEDVIEEAVRAFSELQEERLRFSKAIEDILEALYYGQGLQAVCDIGSELFGNPLCMLDTGLKALAVPRSFPTQIPILKQAWERGYSDNRDIRFLKAQGWFDPQCGSRTVAYFPRESFANYEAWKSVSGCCVGYVRANGVVIAYILISAENKPIQDYQQNWVSKLAQIVSIELQKNQQQTFNPSAMYEAFLTDLLEGQITDPNIIYRRSQLLGRNLGAYHYVVTIRKYAEFRRMKFSTAEERRLRGLFPGCVSVIYKNDVVLLVGSEDGRFQLSEELEPLNQSLVNSGLIAGVSNVFSKVEDMAKYYRQAALALKFGDRVRASGNIFQYADYSIFHAIELCAKSVYLRDICHQGLISLHESTAIGDTDLFQTLFLYLLYMKNATRVCDELNIHRSTLFYRLNKIKELLNVDLDDGNIVHQLMFSYRVIEYMDSFSSQNANQHSEI